MRSSYIWKFLAILLLVPLPAGSAPAKKPALGIAWSVQGNWLSEGSPTPLRSGDAIKPASLLQPGNDIGSHSITILLPDGQRVLYECFTPADCARGFRVPSLTVRPDAFAVSILARIQSVLAARNHAASNPNHISSAPKDEAVTVLNNGRVRVAGLAAELSNGRYSYELRPLDPNRPAQHDLVLQKTGHSIELTVPAAGLYVITITDAQNTPRVDLFLAAITPKQSIDLQSFNRAKERMEQWNDDYAGWPIHDFLRAYLESLMPGAKPSSQARIRYRFPGNLAPVCTMFRG